jgi:hypothetical protein
VQKQQQHVQFFRKLRRLVYEFKREDEDFADYVREGPYSSSTSLASEEEKGRTLTHISGDKDLYVTVKFLPPPTASNSSREG